MQPGTFCLPSFPFVLGFPPPFSCLGQLQTGHFLHSGCVFHAWHCPIVLWSQPSVLLSSLCGHPFGCWGLGCLTWTCDGAVGSDSCDSDSPSLSRALGTTCAYFSVADAVICGPTFGICGLVLLANSLSVSLGCQPVKRPLACLQRAFKDASGTRIFIRDRSGKLAP